MSKALPQPRRKTPWGSLISILLAILYGVSPIDLVPDLIPLLGFVDDALIVPMMLLLSWLQYRRSTKAR